MQLNRLLLLFTFCAFSLSLCAKDNVHLHGRITHPIADSISVRYNTDLIAYDAKEYGTKLNADGSFDLAITVPAGYNKIELKHGDQATDMIVAPGYDLTVTLDGNSFDSTLHYEGAGSKEENFVARHVLERNMMSHYSMQAQQLYPNSPAEFKKGMENIQKEEMAFLDKNKKGLAAGFINYWQIYYQYAYYDAMLDYPVFHEITTKHSYSINMDSIPRENYSIALTIPEKFDDKALLNDLYRVYLEKIFSTHLQAAHLTNAESGAGKYRVDDSVLSLTYKKMPAKSAEYYTAERLYRYMKYNTAERTEYKLKLFKAHFPNSEYLASINYAFDRMKKTAQGKPAMDFTIKTIDGKQMKLSDLKGKVVLLDFWASWCGPCISQMPAARKIEEQYKDKDVVFLYVSIDEQEANWKAAIEKYKIEGVHMLDGGGWKGEAAQLYSVEGVPSYFLIDKKGNFAMQVVPRPSEGDKLPAAIDKLLQ